MAVYVFNVAMVYNITQVSIKRFLKRNLANVGMVQCTNALADKVHKQEVPCTHAVICTP